MHAGYARLAHRFSERVDHTRMATPGQDDQPAPGQMGDDRAIIRGVIEPPRTAGPIEHLSTRPPALVRRPARDHREEEESPRDGHAGTFLKARRPGRSGEERAVASPFVFATSAMNDSPCAPNGAVSRLVSNILPSRRTGPWLRSMQLAKSPASEVRRTRVTGSRRRLTKAGELAPRGRLS